MSIPTRVVSFLFAVTLTSLLSGQGSQRPIGGGCATRQPPRVSGPLAIGTPLQIDDPSCFLGQGGFGALVLGTVLPTPLPLMLRSSVRGLETCTVVVSPTVVADITFVTFPLVIPIPNVPALRGARLGLQTFCHECGFSGCFDLLMQGLEVTIG